MSEESVKDVSAEFDTIQMLHVCRKDYTLDISAKFQYNLNAIYLQKGLRI